MKQEAPRQRRSRTGIPDIHGEEHVKALIQYVMQYVMRPPWKRGPTVWSVGSRVGRRPVAVGGDVGGEHVGIHPGRGRPRRIVVLGG